MCRKIFIIFFYLWCLGCASFVAVQQTDPEGQAEPTLQTIQQEQSHESTEATEYETHSKQEGQPTQAPDVMPNIDPPQGRRRGRGRGRTPGWGSAPKRGMGRGHARGHQGNKLLYLLINMFQILSGMIQKVMEIIDLSTYPSHLQRV